ncbi:MAG: cytochrome c biogenesis factor, partial [Microcystaceae cyanobacterium]
QGLQLSQAALKLDSRYADLKHLELNLWGEKLLQDTQILFSNPQMKAFIATLPPPETEKKAPKEE